MVLCCRIQYLPQSPAFWCDTVGATWLVRMYLLVPLAASGAAADGPGTAQLCLQKAVVTCAVSAPHHRSLRDLRLLAVVPLTAAAPLRHQSHRRQLSCADIPCSPCKLVSVRHKAAAWKCGLDSGGSKTVVYRYNNALHTQAWSPSSCSHTIPRDRASEFILNTVVCRLTDT